MLGFWNQLSRPLRTALVIVLFALFLCVGFFAQRYFRTESGDAPQDIVLPNELSQVSVYVTGAVERPGVYALTHGSRVKDLLKIAGVRKDWDPEGINLAKRLEDEDMVVVPRIVHPTDSRNQKSGAGTPTSHFSRAKLRSKETISLNKASLSDFEALPGVGAGMAKRIVEYRLSHGSFGSVEDLKDVPGLGEKKFQKIKPYLRL